jgi:GTP-binding protein
MNTKELNKLFIHNNCRFLLGAKDVCDFPVVSAPEVAFIGRSNVGKSSLLNALFCSTKIARTSKRPGCTQQINFFEVEKGGFRVVDLPGYGYARASHESVAQWQKLVWEYLTKRSSLCKTWLLIDARRGITDVDAEFMKAMGICAVGFHVILSKTDKLSSQELADMVNLVKEQGMRYPSMYPEIVVSSAVGKIGLEAIRKHIVDYVVCYVK